MKEEILNSLKVLRNGGVLLYPTDTIWGIGCDATNKKAVEKIYLIKKRPESKSLIILLDDVEKLKHYVTHVPDIAWDLIRNVERPLTIIYPKAKNLPENVLAEDHSIAIRIVKNEFCKQMIQSFGKPIVSSSANISGEPAPLVFNNIPQEIIEQVDYVVNLNQELLQEVKPSRIIKLNEKGEFEVIRP